jgi:hypothetical protein
MSDIKSILGEGSVELEFDESLYPKDAIYGAAGPPGLDDLLAMDIGEESAFEDPLGIAMSWEEKYTKKKSAAKGDEAPEGAPAEALAPNGAGEAR